jgi:hypothetical protein
MGNRGRPSSASILLEKARIESTERPRAPHDLNDEECEVWVKVISSQTPDWFTDGNLPLLVQYCRHCVQARHIAELIEKATGDRKLSIRDRNRLLAMQDRETKTIIQLATKMRITQQSVTNHRGNKKTASSKPWEG